LDFGALKKLSFLLEAGESARLHYDRRELFEEQAAGYIGKPGAPGWAIGEYDK